MVVVYVLYRELFDFAQADYLRELAAWKSSVIIWHVDTQ